MGKEQQAVGGCFVVHSGKPTRFFHPMCGREFYMNTSTAKSRVRKSQEVCVHCRPLKKSTSVGEKEVLRHVMERWDGEVLSNKKGVVVPYELDIYLPGLKLAFEYNGDFHHANPTIYDAEAKINGTRAEKIWERDAKRVRICKAAGIQVVVIWESKWKTNQKSVSRAISHYISERSKSHKDKVLRPV